VDGSRVRLTRREFELLRYLVENRNRVISRDKLLERVWGWDDSVETRSVDVHIGRLRSKLGIASRQIETVIGLGYSLYRLISRALTAKHSKSGMCETASPRRQIALSSGSCPVGADFAIFVVYPDHHAKHNGSDTT
jgi:DNA-binding winged helix-turn-helix (wHTH) protein